MVTLKKCLMPLSLMTTLVFTTASHAELQMNDGCYTPFTKDGKPIASTVMLPIEVRC